ncbi:hypothetical protein QMZ65_02900 [Pantoea sp. EABMAA-21]|uniref:hypothetical protein n=1 Tax=Pantoea sp. EABMAA-21 TaxID=3043302 RepID=UPI0024B4C936|nr:hypothetical protein [Pantoea sp. EABMAA-21]MDI9276152.1 hypothetical protein [Pantoea sp. EABMAA-21]
MKKQELFLWGVQAILSSTAMNSAELWDIKRLVLEALSASLKIPRKMSAEQAVDVFYLHIINAKSGKVEAFSAW